jgi:hypothetical protein
VKKLAGRRPAPGTIMGALALFISLGGVGYGATGGTFILGHPNSATSQTGLTSNNAGKALQITQQSTGVGATALGLSVPTGKAPFTVNSGTKVANLNADKLDGLNSTVIQRRCEPGAVSAYAYIDDSALPVGDFSFHDVTAAHFSCAGTGSVRARRNGNGQYSVDFGYDYEGLTSCPTVAVATPVEGVGVRVRPASEGGLNGDCILNVDTFWVSDGTLLFSNGDFTIAQLDGPSRITGP